MIYRIENENGENIFNKKNVNLRGFYSYQFEDSAITNFKLCGFKDITILKQAISESLFNEIVNGGYRFYEVKATCVSSITYQSFYNEIDIIHKKDITNEIY